MYVPLYFSRAGSRRRARLVSANRLWMRHGGRSTRWSGHVGASGLDCVGRVVVLRSSDVEV